MRNNLIDIAKFIASILVILIHTPLFDDTNTIMWQFDAILRLAVPFFIICSGYYLGKNLESIDEKVLTIQSNSKYFLVFLKKMCSIYVVWSIVYLIVYIPSWIESGWFSTFAFVDWGIATVFKGSYYHLWYILDMIYAVIALMIIIKTVPISKFPIVAISLYAVEVIQYGYRILLPEKIKSIFDIFDSIGCLSSITRVLPIILLGIYISKKAVNNKKISAYVVCFAIAFVCLVIERNILASFGQENVSYIIFTLPVTYFLFIVLVNSKLNIESFNTKNLSQISIYIYLIHPIFIELLEQVQIESEWLNALIIILLSIISSYLIVLCTKVLKERRA